MNQPRSKPPALDGYRYVDFLGSGGFADVFLYEQASTAREVAVKVLRLGALDAESRRAFVAETTLMARVSAHVFIVTVHDAGTAKDGRPYLVMEYYSRPHYGTRAAEGGIGYAEVVRLGIQVASAVGAAHAEGILHRDIKPANILVNRSGRPGLTDFGIAGSRGVGGQQAGQGFSVPYAPPEILGGDGPGDEVSDVYSLGATLYTILAGRSPFSGPAGRNTGPEVTARILNTPVPPIGRPDVPPVFEHLILQSLSKDPADRPRSALGLALSLQAVQRDCRLEPTPIEAPDAPTARPPASPRSPGDVDGTRSVSRPMVVRPSRARAPEPELVTGFPAAAPVPAAAAAVAPLLTPDLNLAPESETVLAPAPPVRPEPPAPEALVEQPRRVPRAVAVGAAVLVALVAVGSLILALGGGGKEPPTGAPTGAAPGPPPGFGPGAGGVWPPRPAPPRAPTTAAPRSSPTVRPRRRRWRCASPAPPQK
jgi:serine/threonine protein kinase